MRNPHPPSDPLFALLKQKLKARSITYRDLADALQASEVSVKRWFAQESLTIRQLATIAGLLGVSSIELMQEAEDFSLPQLTLAQEKELLSDFRLLLVASCILNHLTLPDIVEQYDLTEAECIKHLLALDRMRIIDLLPQNRIRLRVSRNVESLPDGPLRKFIRGKTLNTFFDHEFSGKNEDIRFFRAALTPAAIKQFQTHVYQLRQKLGKLHQESLIAPANQRRNFATYVAYREWEPEEFAALRRNTSRASIEST